MQENLLRELSADTHNPDAVRSLMEEYPFFALPLAWKSADTAALSDDDRRTLLLRLRLAAPSPEAMEVLARRADVRFAGFYPAESAVRTPDTISAIDDFLSRYASDSPEENELLERMILNPVPEYALQLAAEAGDDLQQAPEPEGSSQDDRINRFLLADARGEIGLPAEPADTPAERYPSAPAPAPATRQPSKKSAPRPQAPAPDTLLSESLAKIYIKSHKYERAFEILTRLSLDFPEKSRYFADQLRFLRKVINLQKLNRKDGAAE